MPHYRAAGLKRTHSARPRGHAVPPEVQCAEVKIRLVQGMMDDPGEAAEGPGGQIHVEGRQEGHNGQRAGDCSGD